MVKRCSFGKCDSDSRYPDRLKGGAFVPFPKPKSNYEKCLRWIKLCGRPHAQLNVSKINSSTYVCTKHFFNQQLPTKEYPDPLPADPYTPQPKVHRASPYKRRRLILQSPPRILSPVLINTESPVPFIEENKENEEHKVQNMSCQTESEWVDPLEMLSLAAVNVSMQRDLAKTSLQLVDKTRECAAGKKQQVVQEHIPFSADEIISDQKLMKYYTGFSKQSFLNIYAFLVPNPSMQPLSYVGKGNLKQIKSMTLKNQLFLTVCKLRNNFDLVDLGHRFSISQQTAGVIFGSWVNFMYLRFGEVSIWPHRDTIQQHMPEEYKKDFPKALAILDCTEIKIERPSLLKAQSQTYSDYKSSNTLKGLVAIDPRGSLIYSSMLFSGSMSDKEIFHQSGFKEQLLKLIDSGYLNHGDGIMADKGFNIEEGVTEVGLKLNIPPFASSGSQMAENDVLITRKIAKHRVHVERAIRRIKTFKILSNRIAVTHMSSVNQIWYVCSVLTNFMPLCISKSENVHHTCEANPLPTGT